MSLLITGATIIDGVAPDPVEGRCIWIEGQRIKAIGRREDLRVPSSAPAIDARGKYVIPGLMNANVHLLGDVRLENLVRNLGRLEELIAESAQIALRSGVTTVFDTWGPRRPLICVREGIASGAIPGSRIFCAGNIVGFDGPVSAEFFPKASEVASGALADRINAIWVENVGRHLMWLPPDEVAHEVRTYIGKGIDFVKYASNEHSWGPFLAFSPLVQGAIVDETHRAGITAQAHTMSVEGLRIAVEAGCDLIQHANFTGPVRIPEATLELMATLKTGAVIFPFTQRALDLFTQGDFWKKPAEWQVEDNNVRDLIRSGAPLLMANDGVVRAPEALSDPAWSKSSTMSRLPEEDNLYSLSSGHFAWITAMEEKGCAPMDILRAATRNVAIAYRKDMDLGSLEVGKIADILILDRDPLGSARNYRSINTIIKDGAVVDRDSLPLDPILTRPPEPPSEEAASYVPFR
jgi:imidazolonepropionase-like amidohydrolase